ncbi:IFNL3 protein, partial [Smithornis capensis]|nr:IFNL3 protein [Smithornis capensis]
MLGVSLTPLLVLVLGVSLGAAFPHHAPRRGCSLFKYKRLVPHDLKAVHKMQEEFVSIAGNGGCRNCNIRLFDRKWTPAHLSVPDRVVLAEAELNFAITMLQFPTQPSFAEMHQQPLAFLAQAREDLRGCVSAPPAPCPCPAAPVLAAVPWGIAILTQPLSLQVAPSHQPSRKLRHWLQKLQVAMATETIPCLEDYAIRHIFEVLEDLRYAALQEQ